MDTENEAPMVSFKTVFNRHKSAPWAVIIVIGLMGVLFAMYGMCAHKFNKTLENNKNEIINTNIENNNQIVKGCQMSENQPLLGYQTF